MYIHAIILVLIYIGGELLFVEAPDAYEIERVNLTMGDVILIPATARHKVKKITEGIREVLVIEWWNQPKNLNIGRQQPGEILWNVFNPDFEEKRKQIREQNQKIEEQKRDSMRKQHRNVPQINDKGPQNIIINTPKPRESSRMNPNLMENANNLDINLGHSNIQ